MSLLSEFHDEELINGEDGSAIYRGMGRIYNIIVEAEYYKEDGEDTLIKAHIHTSYRDGDGEFRTVYVHPVEPSVEEITLKDIENAILEFECGPRDI